MENDLHLSDEFVKLWHNKVKPAAVLCAEKVIFAKMIELESGKTFPDSDPDIIKMKNLHDAMAVWYIGFMIGDVDLAIIKGVRLQVLNSLNQVYGTLKEDSTYWPNVWAGKEDLDEYKNLKSFIVLLDELIKKL